MNKIKMQNPIVEMDGDEIRITFAIYRTKYKIL